MPPFDHTISRLFPLQLCKVCTLHNPFVVLAAQNSRSERKCTSEDTPQFSLGTQGVTVLTQQTGAGVVLPRGVHR